MGLRLQKVMSKHLCHKCKKEMSKGEPRIEQTDYTGRYSKTDKFCKDCGLGIIIKDIIELEDLLKIYSEKEVKKARTEAIADRI